MQPQRHALPAPTRRRAVDAVRLAAPSHPGRPRDAAARRLKDHRRRPGPQGGQGALQRRTEALRHPDHRRRGGRLRHLRHVRRRARARRGCAPLVSEAAATAQGLFGPGGGDLSSVAATAVVRALVLPRPCRGSGGLAPILVRRGPEGQRQRGGSLSPVQPVRSSPTDPPHTHNTERPSPPTVLDAQRLSPLLRQVTRS